MNALTDIQRADRLPPIGIVANAIIETTCRTMAEHTPPRPLDMVGPRDAAEADALRALLVAAERLTRKRMGTNAGDLIQALINGERAAMEAAKGYDMESDIEDASAFLCGVCEDLVEEWATAGSAGR